MEKEVFLSSSSSLPKGFAFINGCSVSIDRTKTLLIGGHHVRKDAGTINEYVVNHPPNNQVVEFDFMNKKWNFRQEVPISFVRPNLTKVTLRNSCSISNLIFREMFLTNVQQLLGKMEPCKSFFLKFFGIVVIYAFLFYL